MLKKLLRQEVGFFDKDENSPGEGIPQLLLLTDTCHLLESLVELKVGRMCWIMAHLVLIPAERYESFSAVDVHFWVELWKCSKARDTFLNWAVSTHAVP
jgi:hypothetical protein